MVTSHCSSAERGHVSCVRVHPRWKCECGFFPKRRHQRRLGFSECRRYGDRPARSRPFCGDQTHARVRESIVCRHDTRAELDAHCPTHETCERCPRWRPGPDDPVSSRCLHLRYGRSRRGTWVSTKPRPTFCRRASIARCRSKLISNSLIVPLRPSRSRSLSKLGS